jgi:hypothetical protein
MKKHLAFLLALLMALSLVSCGAGEKETDGEPTTPPETDGSSAVIGEDNKTEEDKKPVVESVAFTEAERVQMYPVDYGEYEKKAVVIRSASELAQHCDAINAFIKAVDGEEQHLFGKELCQKYGEDYFAENALWLIVLDVGGSPTVNIQSFEKKDGGYEITVEYVVRADGVASDDIAYECIVLETKASSDMTTENASVKKVTTEK